MSTTSSIIATGTTIMGIKGNVIIPSASDVATGTTFGPNSSLTGTYTPPALEPPLTWSAIGIPTSGWLDAVIYCNNLAEDGESWRLPKLDELVGAFEEQFNSNPSYVNHGFTMNSMGYWSGNKSQWIGSYYVAGYSVPSHSVYTGVYGKYDYGYYVRCVH
jgi:hypothetical protein